MEIPMHRLAILATLIGAARIATAQPEPAPPPPEEPAPTMTPPPPPPAPAPPASTRQTSTRPNGFSVGIGMGYSFPTDLQMPNLTSVRVRLGSGLTFEPLATLGYSSSTVDVGTEFSTSTTEVTLSALVRYPLKMFGRADFELVGGARFSTITVNPDGDDNDTTTTTIALAYGVAVGYWVTHNWLISATALNPIVSYDKLTEDEPGMTTVTSTTTIGVIFDPTVMGMVHLHF